MAHARGIVQTRDVCVHRLLTAKTYEMHMFHSAILNLGLDCALLAHQWNNIEDDDSIDGTPKNKYKSKSKR